MLAQEHVRTAWEFLNHADRLFAEGDRLQGSEKLWGAASHALTVLAMKRGWKDLSHRDMRNAVDRLVEEYNDRGILAEYFAAETFHRNFYHGFLSEHEIEKERPLVHAFVDRVLGLAEAAGKGG